MAILSVITAIYGCVGGLAVLFQAHTIVARRSATGVSLRFLAVYVAGYALYLAYGLAIASIPLITSDAVGLTAGIITTGIAAHYRTERR